MGSVSFLSRVDLPIRQALNQQKRNYSSTQPGAGLPLSAAKSWQSPSCRTSCIKVQNKEPIQEKQSLQHMHFLLFLRRKPPFRVQICAFRQTCTTEPNSCKRDTWILHRDHIKVWMRSSVFLQRPNKGTFKPRRYQKKDFYVNFTQM